MHEYMHIKAFMYNTYPYSYNIYIDEDNNKIQLYHYNVYELVSLGK